MVKMSPFASIIARFDEKKKALNGQHCSGQHCREVATLCQCCLPACVCVMSTLANCSSAPLEYFFHIKRRSEKVENGKANAEMRMK